MFWNDYKVAKENLILIKDKIGDILPDFQSLFAKD
jgi:hypothetical protein